MKNISLSLFVLLFVLKSLAQVNTKDTVNICGKITRVQILQKDWGNSDKLKQIYWVEITLEPDSIQTISKVITLPQRITFKSPSSGYMAKLNHFRGFKEKDRVSITIISEYLEQFINKAMESVPISEIKRL